MEFIHILPKHSFDDEKQSFMTFWYVFFSDWTFFGQEIFSLDNFLFCELTQNNFKPLVWYLLHQNILIINDFMKVYEKLIIFIKSLIFNIFWWKKCQPIGLKVFWVDLQNQNLSKIKISCQKIFESDIHNQRKHCPIIKPKFVFDVLTSDFHFYFVTWNIFWARNIHFRQILIS